MDSPSAYDIFYNPGECVNVVKEYIVPVYGNLIDNISGNFTYDFNYDFNNLYNYRKLEDLIINNYSIYIGIITFIVYMIGIIMGFLVSDYIMQNKTKDEDNTNLSNKSNTNKNSNKNSITDNKINYAKYNNLEINDNKLYLESIMELHDANENIVKKLESNTDYFILVRVRLNKSLQMKKTKYDLSENKGKNFKTNNMYLVIGFHTLNLEEDNRRQRVNVANLILNLINTFNNSGGDYKINDFVITAIGKNNTQSGRNTLSSNEFYRGLININYELFNLKMVHINTKCGNQMRFLMTLPIVDINGLFMDVYNDVVYESKFYKVDKNNFETWDNKAINKLFG